MSTELGRLDELPTRYVNDLADMSVTPLWPSLRKVLPHGKPLRATKPFLWSYRALRPYLIEAGDLTPIEKAERRVLVLANPGLGLEDMKATPSIYIGLQLIKPGETAPNHRHSPSAVRFVVEGEGGFTTVNGQKCPMEKGDLILTPPGLWHEHGHEGTGPVVWLDALDLPTIFAFEASYAEEGEPQAASNAPDASRTLYRRAGLLPYDAMNRDPQPFPLLRFPWRDVREALCDLASVKDNGDDVRLAYVNPETGRPCLPFLGFAAQMLRAGEEHRPARRSASSVLHVIEGSGASEIDGVTIEWREGDTLAVPTHAEVGHRADGRAPAFLFHIDDAPLHRYLGFYEEYRAS